LSFLIRSSLLNLKFKIEGISPENSVALNNRYRTTAIIVSSQIAFTVILTVVVWLLAPPAVNSLSQQTLNTLWAAVIFLAVGAFVMRRVFFRWARLKDITLLNGVAGLLGTLQMNAIILALFATLLPIVGAVITILSGSPFEIIRAEIVALIVFLINFPRKAVWAKIVSAMEKI
jgi:hypothetical protein